MFRRSIFSNNRYYIVLLLAVLLTGALMGYWMGSYIKSNDKMTGAGAQESWQEKGAFVLLGGVIGAFVPLSIFLLKQDELRWLSKIEATAKIMYAFDDLNNEIRAFMLKFRAIPVHDVDATAILFRSQDHLTVAMREMKVQLNMATYWYRGELQDVYNGVSEVLEMFGAVMITAYPVLFDQRYDGVRQTTYENMHKLSGYVIRELDDNWQIEKRRRDPVANAAAAVARRVPR
jgi:hypothetical protein